ncbi:MAG: DUF1080 domain-containing protein [Bacteroidales bacterium]|nr:DUF1080 domain-containing protein [Bacteroidales bacterium]
MRTTRTILLLALTGLLSISCNNHQESAWVPLFNGVDLSGWHIECKPQDADKVFWTVEDSTIYCNSIGRRDHHYVWLMSDKEYGDFILTFKFQAYRESTGNSGVNFRSRFEPDLAGGWLNGPQADINPNLPMTWRTGFVYDETYEVQRWLYPELQNPRMYPEYEPAHHFFKFNDEGNGWNEMVLVCRGTHIKTIVNGVVNADWDGDGILNDALHTRHGVGMKGHLALQLHRNDELKIRFKDIMIKEL